MYAKPYIYFLAGFITCFLQKPTMDIQPSEKRGLYIRYTVFFILLASLSVLFFDRLGGVDLNVPQLLTGVILTGSGIMIALETMFDCYMNFKDGSKLDFLIGMTSAAIAIVLGVGYMAQYEPLVVLFEGFEGGIYLTAMIILGYQGVRAVKSGMFPDLEIPLIGKLS